MIDLSKLTDTVGDLMGGSADQLDPSQLMEGLQGFDPAQIGEMLSSQLDLEALGLADINFADFSPDQIFAMLSEKGVDFSQLDLSALTGGEGGSDGIAGAIGNLLGGSKG
ncbi:MAG: hypothetical protein AAFR23_08800 [Pseudomonadota bacterium]